MNTHVQFSIIIGQHSESPPQVYKLHRENTTWYVLHVKHFVANWKSKYLFHKVPKESTEWQICWALQHVSRSKNQTHDCRILKPKVHSPPFAATDVAVASIHFIPGRPGLPAIGFKLTAPATLSHVLHFNTNSVYTQQPENGLNEAISKRSTPEGHRCQKAVSLWMNRRASHPIVHPEVMRQQCCPQYNVYNVIDVLWTEKRQDRGVN